MPPTASCCPGRRVPGAMQNLPARGLDDALTKQVCDEGAPFLGVCLGMQLMAAIGDEVEPTDGLGWIDARCVRLVPTEADRRVPHVGWNEVTPVSDSPLFDGIPPATDFYFVHSFHVAVRRLGRRARDDAVLRRLRVGRAARAGVRRAVPSREEPAAGACGCSRTSWRSDAQAPRDSHAPAQGLRAREGRALRLAPRGRQPDAGGEGVQPPQRRRARVPRRRPRPPRAAAPISS